MKTVDVSKRPLSLEQIAGKAGDKPLVLMKDGKPLGVYLPMGDADLETISLHLSPKFRAVVEHSLQRLAVEGPLSAEQICEEFGITDEDLENARRETARKGMKVEIVAPPAALSVPVPEGRRSRRKNGTAKGANRQFDPASTVRAIRKALLRNAQHHAQRATG